MVRISKQKQIDGLKKNIKNYRIGQVLMIIGYIFLLFTVYQLYDVNEQLILVSDSLYNNSARCLDSLVFCTNSYESMSNSYYALRDYRDAQNQVGGINIIEGEESAFVVSNIDNYDVDTPYVVEGDVVPYYYVLDDVELNKGITWSTNGSSYIASVYYENNDIDKMIIEISNDSIDCFCANIYEMNDTAGLELRMCGDYRDLINKYNKGWSVC